MQQKSNLIIQVLSMLGGILTAGFFIVFLVVIDVTDNTTSSLIASALLVTTAIISSRYSSMYFLDTINITFYIVGCVLPFIDSGHPEDYFVLLIIVSALAYFFSKGFLLPLIAVLSFNFALWGQVAELTSLFNIFEFSFVPIMGGFFLLNLFERQLLDNVPERYLKYKSVHTAFFISSIIVLSGLTVTNLGYWLSPLIWIGLLFIIHQAMKVMEIQSLPTRYCTYFITLLICVPTFYAPHLSGSLLLILVCFYYGYKKEFAVSILLFICTLSKFYYDLNLTLLMKSIILFASGIVFMIAWYLFTQIRIRHEKI